MVITMPPRRPHHRGPAIVLLARLLVPTLVASGLVVTLPGQNRPERIADLTKAQLVSSTGGAEPSDRASVGLAPWTSVRSARTESRISRNGRWIAWSEEVLLSPTASTYTAVVRVLDRTTGDITDVASQADIPYFVSAVSDDGRYVLVETAAGSASGGRRILRWDRNSPSTLAPVMVDRTTGTEVADAFGLTAWSRFADMSADGSKVVFHSGESSLVAGDTNGTFDSFVRDMTITPATAATTRVSLDTSGNQLTLDVSLVPPAIAGNGTRAAFTVPHRAVDAHPADLRL